MPTKKMSGSIDISWPDMVLGDIDKSRKQYSTFFPFLPIARWYRKLVGYMQGKALGQVQRQYLFLRGAFQTILEAEKELSVEEAKQLLANVQKIIRHYTKLDDLYGKSEYLGLPELEKTMEEVLRFCYAMEVKLKIAANAGKTPLKTDLEYKKALSRTSHHALARKMGRIHES